MKQECLKNALLCQYASGTLDVQVDDSVDATTQKLMKRLEEIDREAFALRRERDAITTALSVAGWRPPNAAKTIYTHEESGYAAQQPFKSMALTDACLKVLRDHLDREPHEQWLDKNQVEYLVTRGGYQFKTEDATNSVSVTLRRLAEDGFCEAHSGAGSRATRYRYLKERLPDEVADSRTTKRSVKSKSGQR